MIPLITQCQIAIYYTKIVHSLLQKSVKKLQVFILDRLVNKPVVRFQIAQMQNKRALSKKMTFQFG